MVSYYLGVVVGAKSVPAKLVPAKTGSDETAVTDETSSAVFVVDKLLDAVFVVDKTLDAVIGGPQRLFFTVV